MWQVVVGQVASVGESLALLVQLRLLPDFFTVTPSPPSPRFTHCLSHIHGATTILPMPAALRIVWVSRR